MAEPRRDAGELDAATAVGRRKPVRRRRAFGLAAAGIVLAASVAVGVWPRDDREPRVLPAPTAPAPPGVPLSSPWQWTPRGALSADAAFRDAIARRMTSETRLAMELEISGVPVRTAVWFADDTAAGRIVVAGISPVPEAVTGVGHPYADRSEVVVWVGPPRAPVGELAASGPVMEPVGPSVSRLLTSDRGSWLLVVTAPSVDSAQVSWSAKFGAQGPEPRVWEPLAAHEGVVLEKAPGPVPTARLLLASGGATVVDTPVVEDSFDVTEMSRVLETPPPASLPPVAGLDERERMGADWAVGQVAALVGADPRTVTAAFVWRGEAAGEGRPARRLVLRLGLPGGAGFVAAVTESSDSEGGVHRQLGLAPVRRGAVEGVFAWADVQRTAEGVDGAVHVVTPGASGAVVEVRGGGAPQAAVRTGGDGQAEVAVSGHIVVDPGAEVVITVPGRPAWRVALADLTDPFDLR
ncbi:hypothetical protein OG216_15310 [Streptomycetaceae bacterium NBC_01309]